MAIPARRAHRHAGRTGMSTEACAGRGAGPPNGVRCFRARLRTRPGRRRAETRLHAHQRRRVPRAHHACGALPELRRRNGPAVDCTRRVRRRRDRLCQPGPGRQARRLRCRPFRRSEQPASPAAPRDDRTPPGLRDEHDRDRSGARRAPVARDTAGGAAGDARADRGAVDRRRWSCRRDPAGARRSAGGPGPDVGRRQGGGARRSRPGVDGSGPAGGARLAVHDEGHRQRARVADEPHIQPARSGGPPPDSHRHERARGLSSALGRGRRRPLRGRRRAPARRGRRLRRSRIRRRGARRPGGTRCRGQAGAGQRQSGRVAQGGPPVRHGRDHERAGGVPRRVPARTTGST